MRRLRPAWRGLSLVAYFALSVLFGLFIAGGLYSGYSFVLAAQAMRTAPSFQTIPVLYLPVPGQKAPPVILRRETTVVNAPSAPERINVLLMGTDQRPGERTARTDTMIIATIDPAANMAGLVSIPRDLWVPIPGHGESRINEANSLGDDKKDPGTGPTLAMKTVQYNLGVPIARYVRVDFNGFRQIVDAIGGIDIDVEKPIIDDTYPDDNYRYDPVYIEPGRQHMNGDLALKYARSRHGNSDFDRAKRQQQVLLAIAEQALRRNLLPKMPELMVILAGTVETNLRSDEILSLAQAAARLNLSQVQTAVLGSEYTVAYVTPTGANVVLPVRDRIRPVIDEMFRRTARTMAESAPITSTATVTTRPVIETDRLAADGARISVLSGTPRKDLAAQAAAYLQQQGFRVTQPGDSGRNDYIRTVVVDYTGKVYTTAALANVLQVPPDEIRHSPDRQSEVDILVILGADFRLPDQSSH